MIHKIIAKRLLATILVLFGVSTVTFLLLRFTPGDPAELMLKDHGSIKEVEATRKELGLDKPFAEQYVVFLKKLSHGDLGINYFNKRKVTEEILNHLPATLLLALSSLLFSIVIGLPMGVIAAFNHRGVVDKLISGFTLLGLSIPSFWLAPILIIIFSIKLNLLPVSGREEGFASLILPTISLGLSLSAVLQRVTRAAVLEVLNEEYITVARAKGLRESFVMFKHALKNAMGPIITVIGLQVGAIATGVVITETIFDWPGIGILLYSGLRSRNYPVIQGCVITVAVIYVIVNLLTDLAYLIVNPRLREAS
jgi:ABC-type dipeptide/oligopeptide/nickel transport system permease component